MSIFFCNIGYMNEYRGCNIRDPISNGGTFVNEEGTGGEVCNFLKCDDGRVYGYFNTSNSATKKDAQVKIERIVAEAKGKKFVSGVDVVFTATRPQGGRTIVGWYKNATVYRGVKNHARYPSPQHKSDKCKTYKKSILTLHKLK